MRCRGGRPLEITLHAKCKVPVRNWSSCRVVDRLDRNSQGAVLIRSTLSTSSLASIFAFDEVVLLRDYAELVALCKVIV